MDFMTSLIVHFTIWAIKNTDPAKYPRGRERLELVAVIICSIFMGSANILMIIQSVQAIITGNVSFKMFELGFFLLLSFELQ